MVLINSSSDQKATSHPTKLSYEDLLEKWFFRMHDPTTLNRQGNDVGTQYRSAIFFTSHQQKTVAEAVKARIGASGKWKKPIVTEIVAATKWYPAESYHQDYLTKHPGGYTATSCATNETHDDSRALSVTTA